ncbi:MAG: ribosome biogenesis GTP-binding protein YihA/YsxC [Holosporales bacterium]|jgi:GTP-binding protein|nr:ribosome biogenesis GTP-binding protein YihA/YsxC [Holosporales bacterium]
METTTAAVQQDEASALFARPCHFVAGAAQLDQLPPSSLSEVAFVGRSNVGKSSLINALLGRKTLVRTSRHPGHTQQINFFELDGCLYLVDLPGYGFAAVSRRTRALWDALIAGYLKDRPMLKRVFLLVDSRHGFKESDRVLMAFLDEAAVTYQCVFTKSDKATEEECQCAKEKFACAASCYSAILPSCLETSAIKRTGIKEVQHAIYMCC